MAPDTPLTNSSGCGPMQQVNGGMISASDARVESIATQSPAVLPTNKLNGNHVVLSTPETTLESQSNNVKMGPGPLLDFGNLEDESDVKHRPPMSVIVVSSPATTSNDMQLAPPSALSAARTERPSSTSTDSMFSTPFRLQPRGSMAYATTGRDGAVRGRKRSAQSMAASKLGGPSSLLLSTKQPLATTLTSTPNRQSLPPCGSTPPRDTRRGGGGLRNAAGVDSAAAMANFQCLSLQSPKRRDPMTTTSPPASSASSPASTAQRGPAMVPGSVGSFQSASIPPRSSSSGFTPVFYGAASPSGSIRSSASIGSNNNKRMSMSKAAAQSPCGGSTKSSPKLAPLTVLQDSTRGAAKLAPRNSTARLPPLPGGGSGTMMSSLWLSLESSEDNNAPQDNDDDDKMRPPRTVHCRKPSVDSISTVHNTMSPLPSLRPSPNATLRSPALASSPGGRGEFRSPGLPTPRTPQTPLPRVTLTPRSTGSRRSRRSGAGLPRFPSPSDVDDTMDVTSPFLNSAAAESLRGSMTMDVNIGNTMTSLPPKRAQLGTCKASSNSLALSADGSEGATGVGGRKRGPLPVLDLSPPGTSAGQSSPMARADRRDFSGGTFMGIKTMSLLNSTQSGGILMAMMEESVKKSPNGGGMDMGSVSDIDEDEGFILACPSAIEQERFESCQPARQRRRRSCDRFVGQTGRDSPTLSPNANLADGMNNVTSSTSLFGMDIAHPTDNAAGSASNAEFGRALKTINTTKAPMLGGQPNDQVGSQGTHTMKRRKSDASLDSIGLALDVVGGDTAGRDLVTPPTIPNPATPPPLSPRDNSFMPVVMPQGTVHHNFGRRQAGSVCIAGADRKSVTMAIARMASEAQGHAESSPVL